MACRNHEPKNGHRQWQRYAGACRSSFRACAGPYDARKKEEIAFDDGRLRVLATWVAKYRRPIREVGTNLGLQRSDTEISNASLGRLWALNSCVLGRYWAF